MLESSFLSNIAELTCIYPVFKRFILRPRGSDAKSCFITVHGVDLLYLIPGTGR